MIPRTRANFHARDLARAVATSERSDTERARLRSLLARYLGIRDEHVLLTPSGRAGLYSILKAMPDRPRVIVPAYTCNAVIEAATLAGKTIEYVDAEADGFNTPAESYRALAGPDSVVIATHQFGIPCEIERTVEISHSKGALVIEDCAPSLGSRVDGKLTGTFGDVAFFSFDISKLVTVPLKGGAVIAKDLALLERIRAAHAAEIEPMPIAIKGRLLAMASALLAVQSPRPYQHFHDWRFGRNGTFTAESNDLASERGLFYRYDFTEWQAAIANAQLERIDEIVEQRRDVYAQYMNGLAASSFALPPADREREWACIRFPIRVRDDKLDFYRRAVARGVDFAFSFTFITAPKEMKRAHAVADSILDLPYYYRLDPKEIEHTIATLLDLDRS